MSVRAVRLAVLGANEIVTKGAAALAAEFPERVRLVPHPWPSAGPEPDVVLYDAMRLHNGDGHDLDELVRETSAAIVVLARDPRPDLTGCALALGADTWISLEASAEELLAAIDAAASGSIDLEQGGEPPVDAVLRLSDGDRLSAREAEMLHYIAQDLRNHEIAERCFLSVNSVKTYIRSAYRKIGVSNRTQAVIWLVQHGPAHHSEPVSSPTPGSQEAGG